VLLAVALQDEKGKLKVTTTEAQVGVGDVLMRILSVAIVLPENRTAYAC
jgi:hypothetical protein